VYAFSVSGLNYLAHFLLITEYLMPRSGLVTAKPLTLPSTCTLSKTSNAAIYRQFSRHRLSRPCNMPAHSLNTLQLLAMHAIVNLHIEVHTRSLLLESCMGETLWSPTTGDWPL